ncbi:hypothetical protein OIU79_014604 [Salix purpurea]|uniref:Uncharacterized protein n=1 Tax=Salix purpurea TaxID=77065 RepID=A0A9Q0PRP1_SALPP|nr:hypothetical protein OIU79_014604 [Salix purpurea]
MANERKVMKIDKISSAEKILFWIERAAILLFVLFGGTPRFLRCSLGLFAFTNLYYVSLAYQRLFVTPPNEPSNALFVFDRYAMWLVAIHFFTGSPAYRYLAAAVFVISNTNLIMKALGVKSNRILYCNPTDCDGEIEEIPETETIELEAYHEMEERATLVVDNINITEKEIAGNKEEDDEEEDYEIVSYKKEVKDQESQETGDGRCCETSRVSLSSMQREDDDVGLLKELNGENCELMKDLADKLLVLEQENEVLSRKLSAESASSTERLNQIMYEYERICRRLEEEKAALNASLSTAQADSDFY